MSERRRVVLDSMTWVQAITARLAGTRGPAAEILNLALDGEFTLLYSDYIESEVVAVLKNDPYFKKRLDPRLDVDGLFYVLSVASGMRIAATGRPVFEANAKDDPILWLAGAGLASHIVSRDEAILNLKTYRHAQILTPPAFLREWRVPKVSEPLSGWKLAMREIRRRSPVRPRMRAAAFRAVR